MTRQRHLPLFLGLLLPLAIVGCSTVEETPTGPDNAVTVSASSLPRINGSAHYTLWFSHAAGKRSIAGKTAHGDAHYVKIGSFLVDANGAVTGLTGGAPTFTIPSDINPQLLIDAIVTVEANNGTELTTGAILVQGSFTGTDTKGVAELELGGHDAFGHGFENPAPATVFLDAPTTLSPDDFARGIWLGSAVADNVYPDTLLPELPEAGEDEAWSYQLWLTHRGTGGGGTEYIPLGRFENPRAMDETGPGSTAGEGAPYAFPGEDFVTGAGARMLNDGTYGVLLSVDPTEVTLNAPFLPLFRLDAIPASLARLQTATLAPVTGRPAITVTIDR